MSRRRSTVLELPCGLWSQGERRRRARLREPTGDDEVYVAERAGRGALTATANGLLARCLETLGPREEVGVRDVAELAVGDRDALLLHLRRLAVGEDIDSTVACPEDDCQAKLDVSLSVDDLLQPPYDPAGPRHELQVDIEEATYTVRCRRATAGDVEEALRAGGDRREASGAILRRCVDEVEGPEGTLEPAEWPQPLSEALGDRLAELDPQAELQLETTCPACGTAFRSLFDPADYLLSELGRGEGIFREVHHLALHYNWGEAEILGMGRGRRRRYLDILDRSLGTGAGR